MNKYKCTGKFNLLILVDGQLREVLKNEEFECHQILNHPYLTEVKDPPPKIVPKPRAKKLNKVGVKKKNGESE